MTTTVQVQIQRTLRGLELRCGSRQSHVPRERLVSALLERRPDFTEADAERAVDRFLAGAA